MLSCNRTRRGSSGPEYAGSGPWRRAPIATELRLQIGCSLASHVQIFNNKKSFTDCWKQPSEEHQHLQRQPAADGPGFLHAGERNRALPGGARCSRKGSAGSIVAAGHSGGRRNRSLHPVFGAAPTLRDVVQVWRFTGGHAEDCTGRGKLTTVKGFAMCCVSATNTLYLGVFVALIQHELVFLFRPGHSARNR